MPCQVDPILIDLTNIPTLSGPSSEKPKKYPIPPGLLANQVYELFKTRHVALDNQDEIVPDRFIELSLMCPISMELLRFGEFVGFFGQVCFVFQMCSVIPRAVTIT